MFGKYIGWVLFAIDLAEVDTLCSDSLLNPKRMRVKMSQLAKALPVADAYGGTRVCPHSERQVHAGVVQERLVPEALARAPDNAGELGFARAESDARLCRRPVLDGMLPEHDAAATCGLTGLGAAGPVRIDVDVDVVHSLLSESVHQSRCSDQVATHALESFPSMHAGLGHPTAHFFAAELHVQSVGGKCD